MDSAAAAHVEDGRGNVARFVGEEPDHGLRDLLGPAGPAERDGRTDALDALGPPVSACMSVSISPGLKPFTRMPSCATSLPSPSVKTSIPALAAA